MEMISQIESIRKELISVITNITKEKECIGTFYKNIGLHHTKDQTEEEYSDSPIVVIHGNLSS